MEPFRDFASATGPAPLLLQVNCAPEHEKVGQAEPGAQLAKTEVNRTWPSFCGCLYDQSPTICVCIGAPKFWNPPYNSTVGASFITNNYAGPILLISPQYHIPGIHPQNDTAKAYISPTPPAANHIYVLEAPYTKALLYS